MILRCCAIISGSHKSDIAKGDIAAQQTAMSPLSCPCATTWRLNIQTIHIGSSPPTHSVYHRDNAFTKRRQRVHRLGRFLRDHFSMYHATVLQIAELLGEHFGRCAGNPPLQLHIVQRAIHQMPEDKRFIFV